jgi:hypothetical protein
VVDSTKTFCLILLGLAQTPELVGQRVLRLGLLPEDMERISARAPFTFKRGLTLKQAREWADAFQSAGARVAVREEGTILDRRRGRKPLIQPLESFTMCLQCGHKQLKAEACTRCGSVFGGSKGEP